MLNSLEEFIKYLSLFIELIAAIIICTGVFNSLYELGKGAFLHKISINEVRLKLGRWLVLALEFELAADIVKSAAAPTWDQIGKLFMVVIIRTILNYFLENDIHSHEKRQRKFNLENQKFNS